MTDLQVGIDIGGICTDLVALLPGTSEVRSIKVPTQAQRDASLGLLQVQKPTRDVL